MDAIGPSGLPEVRTNLCRKKVVDGRNKSGHDKEVEKQSSE